MICAPNDSSFADDGATSAGANGYHLLFRASGDISMFRVDGGVAAPLGGATGTLTPLTTGTQARYKVTVSPTQVKAERLDVVGATNTQTSSTYRGGYFHLGSFGTNAQFYDLTVA